MTGLMFIAGVLIGGMLVSILAANQYEKGYEDGKLEK